MSDAGPHLSVDIVIPQYGNWDVTERCLESLRERDACVRSVVVVDDASPDGAAERLRQRDDVVALILERNRGFAGACNAGAAQARADAVFFLNSDTIVPPGAIARLARELAGDPTIGAVSPRLLYANGTVQGGGNGLMRSVDQVARIFQHLDGTTPQVNVPRDELNPCGAALMIRRDLFRAIGSFDERYRNGFEDVALGIEVWRRGLRCRYVPDATIVHLEGCSRGRSASAGADLFAAQWEGKLDAVPRYRPPDPPCLAVRWHDVAPVDALARRAWHATLQAHAGARVTFTRSAAGTELARVRAALDKRAFVLLAHGAGGAADARWFAPRDVAEARALASTVSEGTAVWIPSQRAARLLAGAGVDRARLIVTQLGFDAPAARDGSRGTVIVAGRDVPAGRIEAIRRAARGDDTTVVDADAADAAVLEALRRASVVAFAGPGDAWGLLGGEALANGALVVAQRDAAFFEVLPADAFVGVDDAGEVADAVADVSAFPERYAGLGERARRESRRRLPAQYAGERVRELARALAHGVPDADTLAITPDVAARLRRVTPAA